MFALRYPKCTSSISRLRDRVLFNYNIIKWTTCAKFRLAELFFMNVGWARGAGGETWGVVGVVRVSAADSAALIDISEDGGVSRQ